MMAPIKERRRRKRIDLALPVKIEYNKRIISAKTKNISLLGAYVEINQGLPVGAALNIAIGLGAINQIKPRQINCQGVVFRCQEAALPQPKNQYGIGIFFRSIPKSNERALSRYIDCAWAREKKQGKIYMRKRKALRGKGGRK